MLRNSFLIAAVVLLYTSVYCQKNKKTNDELLKELGENSCKCIDSIRVYNKSMQEVAKEVSRCIDQMTKAYIVGVQLSDVDSLIKVAKEDDKGDKKVDVAIDLDENSRDYKNQYFEMERYLSKNCKSLKEKISANDKQSEKSFSKNPESRDQYSNGLDEMKKQNFKKAISYFNKALAIDPNFAFAWDNIGICYRKLGEYDEALKAYNKSLDLDPSGATPLQNIAIVYEYKKEYKQSIKAYERLALLDKGNPEVYYGIGQIYASKLQEYEIGLDNMCKAYKLYVEQKSPFRTDAEHVIQMIYNEMKKLGKEVEFNKILKSNNLSTQ